MTDDELKASSAELQLEADDELDDALAELDDSLAEHDDSLAEDSALDDDFAALLAGFAVSEDEDFSIVSDELEFSTDELTGSSPFGSAELPLSPPHAASNPAAPNATKKFFIKNFDIIPD